MANSLASVHFSNVFPLVVCLSRLIVFHSSHEYRSTASYTVSILFSSFYPFISSAPANSPSSDFTSDTRLRCISCRPSILFYSMAFINDKGTAAPYHLFSLRMDTPNLFSDSDPTSLTGIATALKVRFALSKWVQESFSKHVMMLMNNSAVADAILLHRCYVIWGFNWRAIILPRFLYLITIGIPIFILLL
ncbi:hypothetical protein C8J56DRAFT_587727 [Mycena floridula]|nr:hypothetical protein C8J56DRAFT_587727 [Mycena floridula]